MDTIFQLAALIAIPFSYHSPDSYIETNISGTLNILQACRDYNNDRLITTSTSEVYGTAQYVPIYGKQPLQTQFLCSIAGIGLNICTLIFEMFLNDNQL